MMRRLALASALFVAVGSAAPSMASTATTTSNLGITASVPNNCTISASPLNFGTYNPTSLLTGTGTVTTTCTSGASATITLGQGSNPDGGSSDAYPFRQLAVGTNKLTYYLYQDAGRVTVWGNTAGTGLSINGTGNAQGSTVYGQIPAAQNVPAGSYSDTVTATVTY